MVHCVAVAGIEICVGVDAIRGLFQWAVDKRLFEITLICVLECGNACLGFRISEMFVRVRLCFSAACLFFWKCLFKRSYVFLEGAVFSDLGNGLSEHTYVFWRALVFFQTSQMFF